MSANRGLLRSEPLTVLELSAAFLFIRIVAGPAWGRLARQRGDSARRLGFALPAGGEFAFVLFTLAARQRILDAATADLLILAVTLSMMLGPLLLIAHESLTRRWLAPPQQPYEDRKSTRLNSSHSQISYAVFCLKKKKNRSVTRPRRSTITTAQMITRTV